MDWMALKAAQTLAQTGYLTVVVQDNGSLHTSLLVRQQWSRWQEQGLFVFFLPPYCSQMNPIETQWHQLKSHEIAGQMFDNEYDLAMAVIDGMTARSQAGGEHPNFARRQERGEFIRELASRIKPERCGCCNNGDNDCS